MYRGILICESLKPGATLDGIGLIVRKISRVEVSEPAAMQPPLWTLLDFEVDDADLDALTDRLAAALDETGWYCDYRNESEHVIVYPDKVFRYRRGDRAGREQAVAHGRTLGIPEPQLDWQH